MIPSSFVVRCRAVGTGLLAAGALLLSAGPARADEVELKGGTRIEGIVLARSDAEVRVLLPGGDEVRVQQGDVARVEVDADAPAGDTFLRFTTKGTRPGLQAAVVHYVKAGAPRVDLVGAVHAADAAYFREAQRWLDRVDVVLYEMVKPKDAAPWERAADSGRAESAVTAFQKSLARMFDLTFQLEQVDYRRAHFVHADMTVEEFTAAGGSATTADVDSMLSRIRPLLAIAEAFMRPPDDASAERRAAAEGMRRRVKASLGGMLGSFGNKLGTLLGGGQAGDLIIAQRDEVVMQRLDELPPGSSSVAIFYGAAHLPDLEKRLLERGYVRGGSRWLTAWDMSPPSEAPTAPLAPKKADPKTAPEPRPEPQPEPEPEPVVPVPAR